MRRAGTTLPVLLAGCYASIIKRTSIADLKKACPQANISHAGHATCWNIFYSLKNLKSVSDCYNSRQPRVCIDSMQLTAKLLRTACMMIRTVDRMTTCKSVSACCNYVTDPCSRYKLAAALISHPTINAFS